MSEVICSRLDPELVLHTITRLKDIGDGRKDVSAPEEALQLSCFRLHAGQTFKAHEHIPHRRVIQRTQESWIVLSGEVEVTYYDTDGQIIRTAVLHAGDSTITFLGGHNYTCLKDAAIYEVKNGPFEGVEKDKRFI